MFSIVRRIILPTNTQLLDYRKHITLTAIQGNHTDENILY